MDNNESIILIDRYLSDQMSTEERTAFEQKVSANPDLAKLLKEYELTLSALNKNWIQQSWKAAKLKWLIIKVAAIVLIALTVSVAGNLIYKSISEKNAKIENDIAAKEKSLNNPNKLKNSFDTVNLDSLAVTKTESTKLECKGKLAAKQQEQYLLKSSLSEAKNENDKTISFKTNDNKEISEEIMAAYLSLKNLHFNASESAQSFTINASQDTVITGEKGIRAAIPKNVFVSETGVRVVGEITLKLKEFVTAYDMFENGISTNSTQGLLSSGGSCYLMAYQNGKEVQIAPSKIIAIEFPTEYNPEMGTYYGKNTDTGVIWEGSTAPRYVKIVKMPMPHEAMEYEVKKNKTRGIFSDAPEYDRSEKYGFKLKAIVEEVEKGMQVKTDEFINPMLNDSINHKLVFDYFNSFTDFNKKIAYKMMMESERTLEKKPLYLNYKINTAGEIYQYKTSKTNSSEQRRKVRRFARKQGKKLIIPNYSGAEHSFTLQLLPTVNLTEAERSKIVIDSMLKDEFDLTQAIYSRKNRNRINISSLGLVNCDHIPRIKTAQTTIFTSNATIGFMYVFFRNNNSLYRGGFNTVMELQPLQRMDIISILPTETGLQMCIQEGVRAKDIIEVDTHFIPFDKEKIKQVLN